ncbi:topoisomerase II [Phycicoccus endophyticus]|uniref:Topoisomerase II n=1 Tax=Phycicoccus endophyticus TaxID=1690220 RepID=A0A7G9R183_9MICO|nr:DUF5926 family protein [Phycicoccus endophyticus]NHI18871.1 topoisomerase II [Phycicoccus endophyticus]QNN49358.1 topoisomerase II [Phycicoccus endophyticus]GGL35912.1 preprotein translocase SecA [Phycicoccus endophyticus]
MGKASRRQRGPGRSAKATRPRPAPFEPRPFAGLPGESEWVALREILPAATAVVSVRPEHVPDGAPSEVTVATVLPLAWPALHRADGTVLIGTQSGSSSGDASRDLAAQLLAGLAAPEGTPVTTTSPATADTPRLQDVLVADAPVEVTLHEGFDFWVEGQDLEGEAKESLERANESIVPTRALEAMTSAYWVRIGERAHIRLVLPEDEDPATDALARLHAAGADGLGDGTRLLGAFRACGLLVPVWDLDPELEASAHEDELAAWGRRYAEALAQDRALTGDERRARAGLLSRQVTLR